MATWLATEIWRAHDVGEVAVKLTPAGNGRLELYLDGEKIFDRKDEDGVYPNLTRVNELKMVVADKIFEIDESISASI